jgi:FKBP-type peptidyl-prolyl cis-trans isomerase FklB
VGGVVSGWTTALQLMRAGERWMLYLPCQCGYGTADYTPQGSTLTIPAYTVLVFDVQLESVQE